MQYRNLTTILTTPDGIKPIYADPSVPAVRSALDAQQGSTFRTIPVHSPVNWEGWQQTPDGLQFGPAIHSSGPAPYARHGYEDLPVNGRFRDARWLIPAAISNGILMHSTFASTQHVSRSESIRVMRGFTRAIKAVTGVRL